MHFYKNNTIRALSSIVRLTKKPNIPDPIQAKPRMTANAIRTP